MKKILQFLFITITVLAFCLFFCFHLDEYFSIKNLNTFKTYFINMGFGAFFYIIIIHVILNITAIPRVFFTIFTGFVYGTTVGFIYSWIATMAGLTITFVMVRYLFRQSFERRFGSKKIINKINNRLDKHGMWTVVFLRAIYVVPSSVLNYSFGFTKIKTSSYLIGSAIGFIPVVLFNVWAGSAVAKQVESNNGIDYTILIVGVVLLGVIYLLKNLFNNIIPR